MGNRLQGRPEKTVKAKIVEDHPRGSSWGLDAGHVIMLQNIMAPCINPSNREEVPYTMISVAIRRINKIGTLYMNQKVSIESVDVACAEVIREIKKRSDSNSNSSDGLAMMRDWANKYADKDYAEALNAWADGR